MRFGMIFIGYLTIAVLQAKPLDLVSRLLQIAFTKQPGYVRVKSILSIPDITRIILQHQGNSSWVELLDLSKLGFDEPMQKWFITALKHFTTTDVHIKNKLL